ncbi:hypothetical protein GCM10022281_15880 [Sphingomonas rosea]|uniref:B12-binding domain-containing protein n=1 Tax=Sphingomonas rosea TaxID=335605 RepID=A0ABP7U571_9SPHN
MASVIGVGPWGPGEDRKRTGHRGSKRRGARSDSTADHLLQVDIIPSLLVAHRGPPAATPVSGIISADDLAAFAPLAVTLEAHDLLREVEAFMDRGLSVEGVFVELLAPTARLLGEDWTADRLDFLDVTMALWRLQEVLREIAAANPAPLRFGPSRSALFSTVPGDQHGFGAAMIEETFARAGWDTALLIGVDRSELLSSVADKSYDIIGLTLSCDCHIGPLSSLITAVRNVSKNPNLRVMLGGRVLIEDPTIVTRVGADATAACALEALELADRLVADGIAALTA